MTDTRPEASQLHSLVLVADDEREARTLLRRILERESFRVEEASDGSMTVRMAQELRPDLIFMDIQMPGIDGFEAVKLLRDDPRTTRIPIIVVSAAAKDPSDVAKGLGLGADDYLRKPYSTSELVARARSNIRARQLEERLQRRTEELEALIRIGAGFNQELALDELADRLLAAIRQQISADSGLLVLVNPQHQPTLARSHGVDISDMKHTLAAKTLPGYVLSSRDAAEVNDVGSDKHISVIFEGAECVTGIAAPLKHRGQVLGVLALGDSTLGRFSAADFRVLRSIAEQAALAVRNAQLYTELLGYATDLEGMVETRTAALQSAQAQLVRADKLAALGTLAAGVAHEVNNPLQPLLTNLELALEDLDAGRSVDRELLESSEKDVQRIKRIVSRLLDFARPDQTDMESVNVNNTIREVLSLAGKQLEHAHVQVKTDLAAQCLINGSNDLLSQVFLNLMVNAMEAMPHGGILTITSEEQDDQLIVAIRDTGSGISPSQLPQVFDPFFTTKTDGTGLGLSVTYGIIEGHGGQIEVESVPKQFTQFTLRFPILLDAAS
ncbi:MAG: response regulator [Chloroflexota bacterium]